MDSQRESQGQIDNQFQPENRNYSIAVIGQGYVGFPLAMAAASSGFQVVGIDSDIEKVGKLNSCISPITGNYEQKLKENLRFYRATSFYEECSKSDIVILCLPTPLDHNRQPDTSILLSAAKTVSDFVPEHALVINESTVAPGFTREELGKIFNTQLLAFSPERINPGSKVWSLKNTPKLVSGKTMDSLIKAKDFYSHFVDEIVECVSMEAAEMAKLLENSYRLVNISLVNEIAMLANSMNLDMTDVISLASTKPFGFNAFTPSLGAGGHCIPIDPVYLSSKARAMNVPMTLIESAIRVNSVRPDYIAEKVVQEITSVIAPTILVVGIAYKPEVIDTRESPAISLILNLRNRGLKVFWHDDLVKEWNGEVSSPIEEDYHLVVLANPHSQTELGRIQSKRILDARK